MLVRHGRVGDWRLPDAEFMASFRLPTASDKHEVLKAKNPIPEEGRLVFEETSHTYAFDGVAVPCSVTTLVHRFAGKFDPGGALAGMKSRDSWEWKQQQYLKSDGEQMRDEEIVSQWSQNGLVQRSRGTLLHYHIEQYLNGVTIEEPHSPEFKQFLALYHSTIVGKMEVYRTEMSMYHAGLAVAGQADCLCTDTDGLVIWDWKRVARLRMDGNQQMLPPLHHMADCSYHHYCLQLNIYRFILESPAYGFRVSRMLLGIVSPERDAPLCVEVPRLEQEIETVVQHCCGP